MINIIITGNVGSKPELRYTPAGKAVCNFSLASNRFYKNQNGEKVTETTWFRVTCWDKMAEIMNQYLDKGKKILVVAERVEATAFASKTDGSPRSSLEITASRIEFLSGKTEGDTDEPNGAPIDDEPPF